MTRVSRRVRIAVGIVVSLVVLGLAALGAYNWLMAKDYTEDGRALRSRLDTLESDQFLLALVAVPHTTQSTQEVLTCEQGDTRRHWNLRMTLSGGLDPDRVSAVLARSTDYGWQPDADSGSYSKTIAPGVTAALLALPGSDRLQLYANTSDGLTC